MSMPSTKTIIRHANLAVGAAFALGWGLPVVVFWAGLLGDTAGPLTRGQVFPAIAAVAVCFSPLLLPRAYYTPWERPGAVRLYRALGLTAFKRLVTNGDLWNRRARRRDPAYRYLASPQALDAFLAKTRRDERNHLVFLLLGFASAAAANATGHPRWAAMLLLTNLFFNAYPILLQRYHRVRVTRRSCRKRVTR